MRSSLRLVAGILCACATCLLPNQTNATETIYACAHKNVGDIRIVSAPGQCLKSEYELSWEDGLALRQQINELLGRVTAIEAALGVLNEAPTIVAGDDQTILVSMGAELGGIAEDDGLVWPLSFLWEEVSGTDGVLIYNPDSLLTSVSFTTAGEYNFRLSVSDGAITVSDELRIIVYPDNSPPEIIKSADPLVIPAIRIRDAGYWILYCSDVDLDVTVPDDDLPGPLSFNWSIDSKLMHGGFPARNRINATFTDSPSDSVEWPLHIAAKSLYVGDSKSNLPTYLTASLSLAVSDGYFAVDGSLLVQCDVRASSPPISEAGEAQSLVGTPLSFGYQCEFPLSGTVEDDGRPEESTINWAIMDIFPFPDVTNWRTIVHINPNGVAETTFLARPYRIQEGYELPDSVTYTLRLRVSDGYHTTDDNTSFTCIKP